MWTEEQGVEKLNDPVEVRFHPATFFLSILSPLVVSSRSRPMANSRRGASVQTKKKGIAKGKVNLWGVMGQPIHRLQAANGQHWYPIAAITSNNIKRLITLYLYESGAVHYKERIYK